MSTLYAVGCSHTRYEWPTYADILSQEYDKFENWGQTGVGNFAIMHRAMEIADRMDHEDHLIVQWTYPTRFDFHRYGHGWYRGGNLSYNHDTVQDTINKYAYDPDSYEWHTETYIKLLKQYLEINICDYQMMATDFDLENIVEFPDTNNLLPKLEIMKGYNIKHKKFINVRSDVYKKLPGFDHHWTPNHHLKYLEDAGFTITEKMLQYTNKVESLLNEITDWEHISERMVTKNYITIDDHGR